MATDSPDVIAGSEHNVLHNYRSWNYLFTIAALDKTASKNPDAYKTSTLKYVIAKSSGKGSRTIDNTLSTAKLDPTSPEFSTASDTITGFNRDSSGRFDFVIDNVEIANIITPNPEGGFALPTKLKFDIIEPYSMGGFLEALQAAATAIGNPTYAGTLFVLKIEFIGYDDTSSGPDSKPKQIEGGTRYFPFSFTTVDIEVTDKGTLYRCTAVPFNETSFGEVNKLKSDIKMQGSTVGEIITDLFKNINSAVQEEAKKNKGADTKNFDEFEVYWMPPESVGTKIDINTTLKWDSTDSIYAAKINEELRSNTVYSFSKPADPALGAKNGYQLAAGTGAGAGRGSQGVETTATTTTLSPTTGAVSFTAGSEVDKIISSVIRDSTYVKNIIKNLDTIKKDTANKGMITYFLIRAQQEIKDGTTDPQTLKPNYIHKYVVQPYKMHYTRLPGEQLGIADWAPLQSQIRRTYDYYYTGQNKDVINFQLKFNHLYFQAIPGRTGNRDTNDASKGAAATGDSQVSAPKEDSSVTTTRNGEPVAPVMSSADSSNFAVTGGTGQPRQADPYHAIAQQMHESIMTTKNVDLAKADIEIFGDPYYITTGGIGNQTHKLAGDGITDNGEAPIYAADTLININFRTPIDYGQDGIMYFDPSVLPFSGIFRVVQIQSTFASGVFKQKISVIRSPGQVIGRAAKPNYGSGYNAIPKAGEQPVKDSAQNVLPGSRPNDFSLANMLQRGLPSSGLPGVLSNFTGAAGGGLGGLLGGSGVSLLGSNGLLNSVAGVGGTVQNIVGQVKTIAPQLGINVGNSLNGINSLASGIRLSSSGIANIAGGLSNALPATVKSVSNILGSSGVGSNLTNPVGSLATNLSGAIGNIGGSVANAASSLASNVSSGLSSFFSSGGGGTDNSLGSSALASVANADPSGLVGGVGTKLASLQQGIPSDPLAIASQAGIDPTQLSGLDPSLLSQVGSQLTSVLKTLPPNVDISAAKSQGIVMSAITGDTLDNLPALQPKVTAPLAEPNLGDVKNLIASGGNLTGLPGINDIPGLSNFGSLKNQLGQAFGGLSAGLGNLGVTSLTDKLGTAQSSLNSLVGGSAGISTDSLSASANGLLSGADPTGSLQAAQAGLGSVESNMSSIQNQVQGQLPDTSNLADSVTSQFGSLQNSSPLDNLVASANQASSDLGGDWSV